MLNLGPQTLKKLQTLGVSTIEDIENLGVLETYFRLKTVYGQQISLNALWALQGAVLGIPWNQLLPELKLELKRQLEEKNGRL
ncbi:MAG: TfoX/Sxy family DNA transformation protein [Trueperaceae bacterium]|nr:TfoX/Sxy family DNA transformation protein [Trueperaceae bacterium]